MYICIYIYMHTLLGVTPSIYRGANQTIYRVVWGHSLACTEYIHGTRLHRYIQSGSESARDA